MIINSREYRKNGMSYTIRSAHPKDARQLSELRLQIDGESEHLDREPGEAFIDGAGFEEIIGTDTESRRNLFLVAEVNKRIVGFSRCEGNSLKRFAHKVEFGVGVKRDYWGYGIGKHLLQESVSWADATGIHKMTLNVLESNENAIALYTKLGFEQEGILKHDKILSDGKYHNTIIMARFNL
ncbi:N-acetyltransferase [Paenibacillus albidus]|uniref:N-acetyltransferase n=1 Tax=Paenibacillus albidus TaxID=2041023 RepID=A0A917CAM9_9BACL|nr:GNAT family N-acetyltransferase [Paenibacillus albidus]GGF79721.1 N-acetyltransferase [Paenibacillus albidus]